METWVFGIVSLLICFALAFVPRWLDRRRWLLGYWKVLREEIEYCHDGALAIEVLSPLGRLPTAIYDEVFKHIIAQGDIKPAESRTLMCYYDLVWQVNDSLNIIAAAVEREGEESERDRKESRRTQKKRDRFAKDDKDTYYAPVIEIANRQCNRSLLRF